MIPATLIRRYKRFLADVELQDGTVITVHTPNTGSMLGCSDPGCRIWLRDTENPKRKYRYSWEITENREGVLVGVNTGLPNHLVEAAIHDGTITELQGYESVRREVRYGSESSRIDLLLNGHQDGRPCYVEVKNVTTCDEAGYAFFPDAVSARGSKHLRELMGVVEEGGRGVILFCVQRGDAQRVRPADEIDRLYGETLRTAIEAGVEAIAYRAAVTPERVVLERPLTVLCPEVAVETDNH
ncbi:DNA/RNA nuclease SfsA [Thiohalomonas denitrificans]|uniref:Sugar fermentation stimulation protein homolog n=1 Tax=Thiohalomonas denitrificans TaxID=415747 RepID=A0A1G5R119_9GAMM|nr:DNA/RNA nuclease SfsA [Thiohalomonas denitrificans]SCZ67742.1 sugar fermentation stimulation protein A [Thiohalomonas denitrificans]